MRMSSVDPDRGGPITNRSFVSTVVSAGREPGDTSVPVRDLRDRADNSAT